MAGVAYRRQGRYPALSCPGTAVDGYSGYQVSPSFPIRRWLAGGSSVVRFIHCACFAGPRAAALVALEGRGATGSPPLPAC